MHDLLTMRWSVCRANAGVKLFQRVLNSGHFEYHSDSVYFLPKHIALALLDKYAVHFVKPYWIILVMVSSVFCAVF